LISTRTDVDYFQFSTSGGNITLNVNPVAVGPNLDIEASLYDSSGTLIATNNALMSLNATISANVSAGQYFLKVDGVGAGNPTVSPPTGYSDYASLGEYTITGTISAVSGDTLSISATNASKNEGNSGSTAYTFTVNRTGDTTGTSTVNYAVAGSGASPASATDFAGGIFLNGSLTFGIGVTSLPITVDVLGDTVVESNETFVVSLSSPSPTTTTIGSSNATGTILNDDSPPPPPGYRISATSASKAEGTSSAATPFTFTIFREGDLSSAGSVRYTVSGTGASKANKSDFVGGFPRNVTVNFPANLPSVDININVVADNRQEPNEGFRVTLSSPIGGTISVGTADGSIINDDGTGAGAVEGADLIAVADPLWLFVPAEHLTAEQLAVPVTTWINGVSYVGDLAHDHDHHHSHDLDFGHAFELDHLHDHDHDTESGFEHLTVVSLAVPLDTNASLQGVMPLTKTDGGAITLATNKLSTKRDFDRSPDRNSESIVPRNQAVESLVEIDDSTTTDWTTKRRARISARRAAAVDVALVDHADWLDPSANLS
jgi:hypothetical protein